MRPDTSRSPSLQVDLLKNHCFASQKPVAETDLISVSCTFDPKPPHRPPEAKFWGLRILHEDTKHTCGSSPLQVPISRRQNTASHPWPRSRDPTTRSALAGSNFLGDSCEVRVVTVGAALAPPRGDAALPTRPGAPAGHTRGRGLLPRRIVVTG